MTFNNLKTEDLMKLSEVKNANCISIFTNPHRIMNERRKDQIVFKNFVDSIDHILKGRDVRPNDREHILKPARDMLNDTLFWSYQSCGLAVYLSPDWSSCFKLPVSVGNRAYINEHFNLKPLIRYFDSNSRFFLLSLDQHGCKFYEGSTDGLFEVYVKGMEEALKELKVVDAEKQLQLHSTGGSGSGATFHGHSEEENHKIRISEYFNKVDKLLHNALRKEHAPMILAGVDYLHPIYRELNSYQHLETTAIIGGTKDMDHDSLKELAFKTIKPVLETNKESILKKYHRAGVDNRVVTGPERCIEAASEGKIDTLLCHDSNAHFSSQSSHENEITIDDVEDNALGKAVAETLIAGGNLLMLEDYIDSKHEVAAILRH